MAFEADTRRDDQLAQYLLENLSVSITLAQRLRGIAVQPIATIPRRDS